MASIARRPRSDGTVAWRVQFREIPGGPPTTETFETFEDADRFAELVDRIGGKAARQKRDLATANGGGGFTLNAALEDYITRAHHITAGTAADYRRIFDRSGIADTLGPLPVGLITEDDVQTWVRTRRTTPSERTGEAISAKTLRNEHGLLSTVMQHAVTRGQATTNVAKGIKLPARAPSDPLILTDQQYAAIHAAMDPHYQPLVEFLAVTGCRWGEATALQWRDVNTAITPPRVTIRRAWKRGPTGARVEGLPKSAAGHRTFTIPVRMLERLGKPGKPGALVFTNARGTAVTHTNFLSRKWIPACERAEVTDPRPTIHDLRHYTASTLLAAGVPMHAVSRRLGHENITTTVGVYAFLTPDVQVAGLDRMAAMLSPQIAS